MIDKHEFGAGMAVLAGAFGREVDEAIIRAYYAVLGPKLTTAEWQQAVTLALGTETFWPSPATLLQKVKAGPDEDGEAALRHVNATTSQHGGFQFLPYAVYEAAFDAPTKAAIQAVGGLREIASVSEDRYPSLRRRFVAAYDRAKQGVRALPATEMDPRVKQLVRDLVGGRDRQLPARDD